MSNDFLFVGVYQIQPPNSRIYWNSLSLFPIKKFSPVKFIKANFHPSTKISGWVDFVDKMKFILIRLLYFTRPHVYYYCHWTTFDNAIGHNSIFSRFQKKKKVQKRFILYVCMFVGCQYFIEHEKNVISHMCKQTLNCNPSTVAFLAKQHFTNPSKNILLETKQMSSWIFRVWSVGWTRIENRRVRMNISFCCQINSTWNFFPLYSYKKKFFITSSDVTYEKNSSSFFFNEICLE